MKYKIIIPLLLLGLLFFAPKTPVYAQDCCDQGFMDASNDQCQDPISGAARASFCGAGSTCDYSNRVNGKYQCTPAAAGSCGNPGEPCCTNGVCQGYGAFCDVSGSTPVCALKPQVTAVPTPPPAPPAAYNAQSLKCSVNGGTDNGINTAVGCIEYDFSTGGFLRSLLTLAVGIGGGIALLLMLYGTFIVTTSAGIPDKLNQGKEIITSAATGLIFIILSIVLMNLIGVSILGLPGL
jgi:hypothetical protein